MKSLISILIVFSFLDACSVKNTASNVSVESHVRQLIENTCTPNAKCKIKLSQATGFDWDEFYFFDVNVEEGSISQILGFVYNSSSRSYSRKWIFLKKGKLVHAEEYQISEIDKPMLVGDVDVDTSGQKNKYGPFSNDADFEAATLPIDDGNYYRLRCMKCP